MSKPGIKVEGLNKAVRAINKLEPSLVQELLELNKDLAGQVANTARAGAPRRSGTLAGSIRASGTKRSGVVRAGKKAVPYAGVIHFGWPRHSISPNPFLWDALDSRRAEIQKQYVERVEEICKKVK